MGSGMETEMSAAEKAWASERATLEGEIGNLRAQLAAQIMELKELMDSKLALDAEIMTYRRLLQGEESRVKDINKNLVDGPASKTATASSNSTTTVTRQLSQQ